MGKKSAQNLLDGIEASKWRGLTRLLAGLSIYMVGDSMAELLTAEFRSIDDLLAASKEQHRRRSRASARRGRRASTTSSTAPTAQKLVEDLREPGVKLTEDAQAEPERRDALAGKTFVVTGTLEKYKREEIEALIKSLGGKAAGSVSSKTDYVLAGEKAGQQAGQGQGAGRAGADGDGV